MTFQPFRVIDCVERRLRPWPRQYDASKRKARLIPRASASRLMPRVSMETNRLEHSLSRQISYYSDLIQRHPGWEYAGVFADNGISGTSTNRPEFQRMIAECEAGHIDIILTKSFSRFARNTLDMLVTIRRLKELGISVRFEKEGIDTLTESGELLLTLLASFAQEESRSISENVKWGVRKRMEQGIPNGRFRILGYRWQDDGRLVVVPEEAAIVRRIYQDFLDGKSAWKRNGRWTRKGIRTINGCRFQDSSLKCILTNITYTGNLILQKEYITDPIDGKRKKNHGELPQFFVADTHEAIIDRDTFDFCPTGNGAAQSARSPGKQVAEYLLLYRSHQMRVPRMQLCTQRPQEQSQRSCLSYRDRRLLELRHDKKRKADTAQPRPSPSKSSRRSARMRWGFPPLTRRSLRSGLSALPSADSAMLRSPSGTVRPKEFDWVSTGHQECWTSEARERKRQMMLERWAKQKCQR